MDTTSNIQAKPINEKHLREVINLMREMPPVATGCHCGSCVIKALQRLPKKEPETSKGLLATFHGIPVYSDPEMMPDEFEFRDAKGKVLQRGKISDPYAPTTKPEGE